MSKPNFRSKDQRIVQIMGAMAADVDAAAAKLKALCPSAESLNRSGSMATDVDAAAAKLKALCPSAESLNSSGSMAADVDAAAAKLKALCPSAESLNRSAGLFSEKAGKFFQVKEDRHSFDVERRTKNEDELLVGMNSVSAGELMPMSAKMSERMKEHASSSIRSARATSNQVAWSARATSNQVARSARATSNQVAKSARATSNQVAGKLKDSKHYVESALRDVHRGYMESYMESTDDESCAMDPHEGATTCSAEERRSAVVEAAQRRAAAQPCGTMHDWRCKRLDNTAGAAHQERVDSDDLATLDAELEVSSDEDMADIRFLPAATSFVTTLLHDSVRDYADGKAQGFIKVSQAGDDCESASSCSSSSVAPEPHQPDDDASLSQSASTIATDLADEISEFGKHDEPACFEPPVECTAHAQATEPQLGARPWYLTPSTATWLLAAP
jgi:hypothetical protein